MFEECIRCNEAPSVDEPGYCDHYPSAIPASLQDGLHQLRE
jgi:hypothetical protein